VPVYEYRCTTCNRTFSKLARHVLSETDPLPVCASCGSTAERLLSSFAYHRSLQMQIDQIDPQIEREMDAVDSMKSDPISRLGL
jgi:putative FmdB family regulatory protein